MKRIVEALNEMMPAFVPVGVERVDLKDAAGRYLGAHVAARFDLPPFDNSAMDGYAVRAADVAGATDDAPIPLPVGGESRAGGPAPPPLEPHRAIRIFTGAVMPSGADAVVIQENTDVDGPTVLVKAPATEGANVRARASDLARGSVMLAEGSHVGPGEIGLMAAQRYNTATVYRRPVVAILCTGDELRDIADPVEPGTIVNSNAYAISAQVREAGGVPWVLPNVPDELDITVQRVREALTADLVVTCGGVSVGDYDLVKQAFDANRVDARFWKVRIKPGKPLTFGRRGSTPLVGLPGNPVSAMVTFEVFVRPAIRRMLGDPRPFRVRHTVDLARDHRHSPGRPELIRATVERTGDRLLAHPLRLQGSGSLPSMVGVDALVLLEAGRRDFRAGEPRDAVLLHDRQGSTTPPFDA